MVGPGIARERPKPNNSTLVPPSNRHVALAIAKGQRHLDAIDRHTLPVIYLEQITDTQLLPVELQGFHDGSTAGHLVDVAAVTAQVLVDVLQGQSKDSMDGRAGDGPVPHISGAGIRVGERRHAALGGDQLVQPGAGQHVQIEIYATKGMEGDQPYKVGYPLGVGGGLDALPRIQQVIVLEFNKLVGLVEGPYLGLVAQRVRLAAGVVDQGLPVRGWWDLRLVGIQQIERVGVDGHQVQYLGNVLEQFARLGGGVEMAGLGLQRLDLSGLVSTLEGLAELGEFAELAGGGQVFPIFRQLAQFALLGFGHPVRQEGAGVGGTGYFGIAFFILLSGSPLTSLLVVVVRIDVISGPVHTGSLSPGIVACNSGLETSTN